jgi:hypothetical protein
MMRILVIVINPDSRRQIQSQREARAQKFPLARIPSPSIHHCRGLQRNFGILRQPGSNRMNIADHNLNPNVQHASFSPAAARLAGCFALC